MKHLLLPLLTTGLLLSTYAAAPADQKDLDPQLLKFVHLEKDLSQTQATLRDGRFRGDHLEIQMLMTARGEFNGDKRLDGLAVCRMDTGGSGNFRHLALLLNDGTTMVHVDSHHLGDRIRVTSIDVQESVIVVEFYDRGPGDAMSVKPYLLRTSHLRVIGNRLAKEEECAVAEGAMEGHE